MLVAVAAMASVSCQKQEIAAPETISTTLILNAEVEQTKTFLGENNTVLWGENESVMLYLQDGAVKTVDGVEVPVPKFIESTKTSEFNGNPSAQFSFTFDGDNTIVPASEYMLGGVYPASAAINDNKNASQYKISLPATQTQVEGKYDPSAYIMVLKPTVVTEVPTEYTASFRRAVALNKITLSGVEENISSVEVTVVPENKFLAGRRYIDLTTGESGEIYYDKSNKVTVNGSFTGNTIDVWFTSWGVELAQGEELTIKMTSATKTYTRTIAARSEGIKFEEGYLNKLAVNMSSAAVETLDNLSGAYLIVNTDLTRAAQAWANGNNLPEFELNVIDGVVYESEGIENCKMTIEQQADGKYTIKDANGLYLYAASSSSNHLKGQEAASSWTIEQDGDKYILTSSAQTSRNIMKYNDQSKIFSCYSSGQKDITLYKYSDIKPDTTPSVSVTETTSPSIGAEGGDLTFTCTTKNLVGETLEVVEESDYLTWSVVENVVTITVAANEAEESRTLNATIKCGSVEVPVTITQAGKPAEGGDASIETWNWEGGVKSDFAALDGVTASGLGSDYAESNAPYRLKLDTTGDYFIVKVDGAIQNVTVGVKMLGGASTSYLDVQASVDGYSFSSVEKFTISGTQNTILDLVSSKQFDSSFRYLKFYFTKGSNVGVGPISITYIPSGETPDPTPDPEPEPDPTPDPDTPTPSANTYTKYTGDLVEGDYIIVYENGAMKASVSSDRLSYSEVSPVQDKISDPDGNIVWHIAPSGSYWTIYNAVVEKYAASNGTKNKAALNASATDDKSLWTVSGTSTYEFVNKHNKSNSINSNLRRNGTYGFACYSTGTGGALTLYKKD